MTQQVEAILADGSSQQLDIERDSRGVYTFAVPADAVQLVTVPVPMT